MKPHPNQCPQHPSIETCFMPGSSSSLLYDLDIVLLLYIHNREARGQHCTVKEVKESTSTKKWKKPRSRSRQIVANGAKEGKASCTGEDGGTNLPLLHLRLHPIILLDQILQDLAQTGRVRLQRGHNLGDGALHKHAVDHAETLALGRQRLQGFQHDSISI